ncbi:MAG: hypothetical protein KJ981_19970 [Alphaproteobacteria bacterium]|nr:hypothetical protein [Alphaproteobacteria bacterium]MBU0833921.1 hypothetical protein [Alphaproteobacteria bacterium]MBU1766163.1 hypothetical protein [Alphaproteobacteria bacterium]
MEYAEALIGTVVGGSLTLLGVVYSNYASRDLWTRQAAKQDSDRKKEIHRGVAEDLYINFSEWANFVISSHFSLYSVMDGKISYNDHLDMLLKSKDDVKHNHHRMEYLLKAYYPHLVVEYAEVRAALEGVNNIIFEHKKHAASGHSGRQFRDLLLAADDVFDKRCEALKEKLVEELKRQM